MPDQKQSILLGALVTGLLSTSYLGFINLLCCAGVIIGSLVAVWHYTSTHNLTIPAGKGAVMGLITAIVGALFGFILTYVLMMIGIRHDLVITEWMLDAFGESMQPEQIDQMEEQINQPVSLGTHLLTINTVIGIIVSAIFGAVGGAIGAAIFKKGGEAPAESTPGMM